MDFLMTKLANSTDCSRRRIIAYWVTTVIIAAEFAVGGVMDILRLPPFFEILRHLAIRATFPSSSAAGRYSVR
jgi:hypothetical protein